MAGSSGRTARTSHTVGWIPSAASKVAASLAGKRGIVKITPDGNANLEVAGQGLVGMAFAPGRSVVLATTNAVHHLAWNIAGLPLIPE